MTLIPVLKIYNRLGLTGTIPGIWLAHTGYGLPFAVYLLRNFFGTLPPDMFESAYLDGASPFTAFFRLVLPLSLPALASLAIFQLWSCNAQLRKSGRCHFCFQPAPLGRRGERAFPRKNLGPLTDKIRDQTIFRDHDGVRLELRQRSKVETGRKVSLSLV